LAPSRHESAGVMSDRDVAIVRLLAPHIRRAIAILDLVATGILLVRRDRANL
jgi:hypothetical protein